MSQRMEKILGLDTPPLAVKIVKKEENSPSVNSPPHKSRYCQLLMLARKGQTLMLTAEDLACPAAKAALGLAPLPEKISTGEMLCTLGLFGSKEAAARTMKMIPRINLGSTKAVIAGPLENFPVTPEKSVYLPMLAVP